MGIPLRQMVVYKVAQLFQTSSFLIHSWQINNTCSLFLLLVQHIQAFMGEFALFQCCTMETSQLQFEGLHGEQLNLLIVWFQLTSLRSPLFNN